MLIKVERSLQFGKYNVLSNLLQKNHCRTHFALLAWAWVIAEKRYMQNIRLKKINSHIQQRRKNIPEIVGERASYYKDCLIQLRLSHQIRSPGIEKSYQSKAVLENH